MIEQSLEKQNICRKNDLAKRKFMNWTTKIVKIVELKIVN